MSIRSFAVDLLPAKLHGLGGRAPVLPALPAPAPAPEVSTFDALAGKLGYLSKADFRKVREAYKFADQAHLGQMRASGDPYITHPVAVAGLVADWKLDAQALMAAVGLRAPGDAATPRHRRVHRFGVLHPDRG